MNQGNHQHVFLFYLKECNSLPIALVGCFISLYFSYELSETNEYQF